MAQLNVYRASAGSGKTYTLTQKYISLLFKDPTNYRHTLAVTFTNKATTEMRSRILVTLHNLSDLANDNPEHMSGLMEEFSLSKQQVREKSAELLRLLLHDYSRFSISTIDSFFQQVTRSFAYELGLPLGFRLELEAQMIMQQAIDQLILEMNEPQNRELKAWLIQFAQDRVESNRSWNIASEIKNIGGEIIKESYQAESNTILDQIKKKNALNDYKKELRKIIDNAQKKLKKLGEEAEKLIRDHNLNIESDFSGKSRSPIINFRRISQITDKESWTDVNRLFNPEPYLKMAASVDALVTKSASKEIKSAIEQLYTSKLRELAKKTAHCILNERKEYYTAKLILPNLNALGLVSDLNDKIMQLCREQNVFLISSTNHLLTRIIDNNEIPFIYEKTGTRFYHYMIDEFQDTSTLQYQNFLPLIKDSLAASNYSLVVGDVKQAIYRWRNSDWNILAQEVVSDFERSNLETLNTNWRSSEEVVNFNNLFFEFASTTLQNDFNSLLPEEKEGKSNFESLKSRITNVYSDTVQKLPKKENDKGQILMQFIESDNIDEFYEEAMHQSIKHIEELIEQNFKLSDIAVLVRTNKEAVLITNALLSGKYSTAEEPETYAVISNESLIINNSEAVQLIVAQLEYLLRPHDDLVASFIRLHLLKKHSDQKIQDASDTLLSPESEQAWEKYKAELQQHKQKPLYELIEAVSALIPAQLYAQHSSFIQGFLSVALNFINNETADLNQFLTFWQNKGSRLSLAVPEGQKAIKVMTIHKSKGLEFGAVVLPFVNWKINNLKHDDFLWLKPKTAPFNTLSLVPVNGVKALEFSHFADDYFNELLLNYVDSLNVAYVALTRAKHSIALFGLISKRNYQKINSYANLMYLFSTSNEAEQKYPNAWDEETLRFSIKGITEKKKESRAVQKTIANRDIETITLQEIKPRLRNKHINNHLENHRFFDNSEQTQQLNKGKLMHQLFELIKDENDVESALLQLRLQGKLSGDEIRALRPQIQSYLHNPLAKNWFNNYYQIKTEATILAKNIKRPDRVMIGEDEIVVVDYKFGSEELSRHHQQVREYLQLVQKITHKKAKGYVWYMESNKIVEVSPQTTLF